MNPVSTTSSPPATEPAEGHPRKPLFAIALLSLLAPFIIAVAALGLRLYGTDWDGGNFYHPDERSIYMRADCMYRVLTDTPGWQGCVNQDFPEPTPGFPSPLTFLDKDASPLNPHWFPLGSIIIYVLVGVRFLLTPFMDNVGLHDLAMAGRTLAALADAASVLLLYFLGARLFGRATGLLASGLLAVTVINIQQSHFYRPEAFVVLLALGAFWWMLNVLERGRWRDHFILGLMVGMTFGFRSSSLPMLVPLAVTYGILLSRGLRDGGEAGRVTFSGVPPVVRRAAAAGAMAFGTFAVLQPYALLDFGKFISDLAWEAGIARNAGQVPYTMQYVGMGSNGFYELRQSAVWALGLPLGILAWAGLGITAVANVVRRHKGELLLLAWTLAVLFTIGGFEVKFLRYVSPVLPVMVLLGSRWLILGYEHARHRSRLLSGLLVGVAAFVMVATVFYAIAFVSSYARPHPGVQASEWLNSNVLPGSLILTDNHWDEGFPNLRTFWVVQLPMYERDTLAKLQRVSALLADADYIVAYSNRPWGSITRLPQRYPYSSAYYRALFDGSLGYELAHAFQRFPTLLGVTFAHDPFTTAGVARPDPLPGVRTGPLTFNLGYADENVTNYDRPLVLVWRNIERLSADAIAEVMGSGSDSGRAQTAMLTPDALATQQAGGTWTEVFTETGWNRIAPWLVWLLAVELIFLAALPLSVRLFRWLPDRGVILARPLGLLLVAWLVWVGASVGLWAFGRGSVALSVGLVALASLWVGYRHRHTMLAQARKHWRYLVGAEALFLVAFIAFMLIRAANPDLWHPWRGGEKPMDLAYLTAVIKSTAFPPYDPWYAGGHINYYYFGFVIVGALVRMTGIVPEIAYNLAVPTLFAVTLTTAFSLGYNFAEALRRGRRGSWVPTIAAGGASALLVVVLANLDGAGQLIQGAARTLTGGRFGAFDFWRSSRLMPGEIAITEFPFWTFLFADLHAHLIAIPFQLLGMGLLLNIVLSARSPVGLLRRTPAVAAAAWGIGALAAINTWDVPIYLLLALVVLGLVVLRSGGDRPALAVRQWFLLVVVFWGLLYALWLPFHLNYDVPFEGLRVSRWRTVLWHYLAIHGLLLFIGGTWLLHRFRQVVLAPIRRSPALGAAASGEPLVDAPAWRSRRTWVAICAVLLTGVWWTTPALREWTTAAMLAALVLVAAVTVLTLVRAGVRAGRRRVDPAEVLLLAMVAAAFGLGMGVDVVTLGNDIDRMNTVFKLYLNAWLLLGVVGGPALWHLWSSGFFSGRGDGRMGVLRGVWLGMLVLLVLASAIFPVLGTRARLADRFDTAVPLTLDGRAFQRTAVYADPRGGAYPLHYDALALDFLRQNVAGSPVVLEGVSGAYRWTPRVAKYTGLPVVVGYEWHQIQQRGGDGGDINVRQRIWDVETAFGSPAEDDLWRVVEQYGVQYVYVGPVERLYFPDGIAKFDALVGRGLDLFYDGGAVRIYQVSRSS